VRIVQRRFIATFISKQVIFILNATLKNFTSQKNFNEILYNFAVFCLDID